MEVDVVRRHAVDAALDLGEAPERLERARANTLGQVGRLDELADLAVVRGVRDRRRRRFARWSAPIPCRSTRSTPISTPVDAERGRDAAKRLELGARVEERREQHVAGEPADAVEVRDAAQSRPRAIRAAIVPAPSPSSMPTTASAAAHEASIALSAVVPPCAEP